MDPKGSLPHSQVPASCPHPESARSSTYTSHFLNIHLILSSHLSLSLPSGLFHSDFPTITLYMTLFSPIRATYSASLILLDFIIRKILGEEYRSWSSSLRNFPHSTFTSFILGVNILLNTILKHLQPTYLPQYKQPSFTPIQNNRQNYSSVK